MRNHLTDPGSLGHFGGIPNLEFTERFIAGKRRLIGIPNKAMRLLHERFGYRIRNLAMATDYHQSYGVRMLPSATGCVKGSNPLKNALRHIRGRFFYVTDLKDAYPRLPLDRLALLLVFLERYTEYQEDVSLCFFADDDRSERLRHDPLYTETLSFLRAYFAGPRGTGLAVGGPLSPYLMNLFCEVFIDTRLRRFCERRDITYTRYVDDLVFSSWDCIGHETRRALRDIIEQSGMAINHRKSHVLARSMGTVHVTKVGLIAEKATERGLLVFPQKKRRKLHGAIRSYLVGQTDWPEVVSGLIAEFLYYYKHVEVKTRTDYKTFGLCKEFEKEWAKYDHDRRHRRRKNR